MFTQATARAVVGPFTAREVTLLGGTALLALAALLSFGRTRGDFVVIVLGLLAPLAVGVGIALRRMRQSARVDLGSFTLEQLAAVVSAAAFIVALGGLGGAGSFLQFLAVVGSLAMVLATWGAHWIGAFRSDFVKDTSVSLLRRDVLPSAAADGATGGSGFSFGSENGGSWFSSSSGGAAAQAEQGTAPDAAPAGSQPAPGSGAAGSAAASPASSTPATAAGEGRDATPATVVVPRLAASSTEHTTVIGATARPENAEPVAFWFAVPDARPARNRATGAVEFTVEPGTWWLAVRTLPEGLVVRHDDGREGLLEDTTDLERG